MSEAIAKKCPGSGGDGHVVNAHNLTVCLTCAGAGIVPVPMSEAEIKIGERCIDWFENESRDSGGARYRGLMAEGAAWIRQRIAEQTQKGGGS